jgi:phospholipid/cholesterol/gamma-HCH transport system substrate-binding protein
METKASYVAVGAFVLALVAGFVGFVLWIGKFQVQQEFSRYDIRFAGSVTGLQVEGTVRYRGIQVGRVIDIRIDPENIELVRVTIEVDRATPVRVDTVASLELQGITGVSYVLLSGGLQASAPLPQTMDEPYPVIRSVPSKLEQLFQGAPDLIIAANRLVDRVTLLFDDKNVQAIAEVLDNVRNVTGSLGQERESFHALLTNGAAAADQIRTMSAEVEGLAHDLRGSVGKLSDRTDKTVADLEKTSTELRKTAQAFTGVANQVSAILKENRAPIRDFSSNGLYELTQMVTEARQLVANLTRITSQIERDPARFFFGDRRQGFEPEQR